MQDNSMTLIYEEMKYFVQNNHLLFDEIVSVKYQLMKTNLRVDQLFTLMDKYNIDETQGIFFQGQIFDY